MKIKQTLMYLFLLFLHFFSGCRFCEKIRKLSTKLSIIHIIRAICGKETFAHLMHFLT